ncbi:hypothetical protein AVEN_55235-1 [Araneus ventricosus]|uniref:Uncharacterized protein n=1 Tax=Araneus ventricosus TaxID=182803 RepID=A0A4Y2KDS4_ARAVE|nr:hypothetical protein AVEN_55235-1 [Araneus ventricosus]
MKEEVSTKRPLVIMLENKICVNEQQNPVGRKCAQPPPFSRRYRKDYLGNENFPVANDEHNFSWLHQKPHDFLETSATISGVLDADLWDLYRNAESDQTHLSFGNVNNIKQSSRTVLRSPAVNKQVFDLRAFTDMSPERSRHHKISRTTPIL